MSTTALGIAPRTLIEAFLPSEGAISLKLVYKTANAAGIADQALRLALRRMIAAAEVTQSGRGRGGTIELTVHGRARLDRDRLALRLALAQDEGHAPWDGCWRLFAASTPEADRAARDSLRRRLTEAGAAVVSTGLYLSPHDLAEMFDPSDHRHLVQGKATALNVRGVTDPPVLTELLWPQAEIVERYTILEQVVQRVKTTPCPDPEVALVRQLHLAEALEQAMRSDPLIPPELRSGPWAPARIRRDWHATWNMLTTQHPGELLYRGWLTPSPPMLASLGAPAVTI